MKSKSRFTKAEAEEIVRLIKEKLEADPSRQKGIRGKIRKLGFYASEYGFRDGYTVEQFLSVAKITGEPTHNKVIPVKVSPPSGIKPVSPRVQSDENYVIDLCDEVLNQKAIRQHRFDFLRGDAGTRLPVDAWYPALSLVVEYRERQHTEEVNFFDRRQTVSGMSRGEQRKHYDQLRRDVLPKHGIQLVEIGYEVFLHTPGKRLIRNRPEDLKVVRKLLEKFIKK